MDSEIIAALIQAGGSVFAAVIGVTGVWAIVKHRSKVQRLAQQVEAYYYHEGNLVREVYRLKNDGAEIPESSLAAFRGQMRNRLCSADQRPTMTAKQASELRDRLL